MSSTDHSPGIATLLIRNRHLLSLTIIILLVAGISALLNLPRIEDPRITNRNPNILTFLPGASAARVETLVTKKIEDRLREIAEIKKIASTSSPSVSLISIELQDQIGPGENETVFSKIRDKLADATTELPLGASLPEFDDKRGAVAYSLLTAIEWRGTGEARLGILSRLAEELADRLRNIPGTDNVRLFGEPQEEITVTADPAEFAALGLTTAHVAELIRAADAKTPAGILRTSERDVLLEVEGALDSTQRIAHIPVANNGTGGLVSLGDIAQIAKRWQEPPQEIALADGTRTVLVAARVEDDVHVDQWATSARAVVAALAKSTDDGIGVEVIFDQSRYTEERLANLGGNLLAGAAVVILVVLIGMGWRSALIVGAALPLSLAFALFGFTFFGQQIHQMTVFGLIIALGLLIDNAIVVTDEVRKQLRQGLERIAAVAAAVRHLFAPLLASTLTTVLGFMPIFLLSGNIGDFIGPIAISVVLALIGSFLISMTVIATLAGLFVNPSRDQGSWWRDGITNHQLTELYRGLLLAVLQWPRLSVLASLILPILGFYLATTLGTQFFPPADRDQFEVEVWLGGNASINHTTGVIRQIETVIREQDGVERVDWLVGSSYPTVYYNLVMNKDNDTSYAHAIVSVRSVAVLNALISRLQAQLDEQFPQAQVVVSTFGQGPPFDAPVAFRIIGPQLAQLKQVGEELRRIMHTEPAILHTQASIAGGDPKLWFAADEYQARLAGFTLQEVAGQFQTALEGRTGGSVLEDLEELPVRIRYGDEQRASLDNIGSLKLIGRSEAQSWVPAAALGDISLRPEPGSLTRLNGERVNDILGYVAQGTLPLEVTQNIMAKLAAEDFELEPGYRLEIAGGSAEQGRAIAQLMTYVPVLVALMVATLVLSFRSVLLAGVIAAVALMSVGLGLLSLWLSGFPLGFNPILGSAGLVGVAINGAIVVLAAIRANPQAREGDLVAIVQVTVDATRHILATTLTTIGGFLPLLIFTGGDFWPPLAVVIAGGVGFSVVLSLLFTPAIYGLCYGQNLGFTRFQKILC